MIQPTLSPLQAWYHHRLIGWADFTLDGFSYMMDGPMMCPIEAMAPVGKDLNVPDRYWYTTGEPGDPITSTNEWINVD